VAHHRAHHVTSFWPMKLRARGQPDDEDERERQHRADARR
jgi:hypothetical protein